MDLKISLDGSTLMASLNMIDKTPEQMKSLEEAGEIVQLLKELSLNEGESVEVLHPNLDDGPANAIVVRVAFGKVSCHYYGDSLLDCLRQAKAEIPAEEEEDS